MTLANKLTLSRILMCPFFILFLFSESKMAKIIAFFLFVVASFSDLLDGYLARRRNEITPMGKIIDPVADKVLVYSGFICFIQLHLIPFWMVIIIMARDFFIMGLRVEAARSNVIISASNLAKAKTAFEYIVIFFVLLVLICKDFTIKIWASERIIFILMGAATLLAVISGIQYWINNRENLG
ncbi:MAG: CDP-diacylglycerol--glycerol-3-phosphate 3-phosphatidyltransferase [Candidatus Aerophobetes bacterium]|nr:CDP-diacylglycerol--glycerol-3-phosphate 3-phosphatidyltransferase [Candidatus Aerophobetes bacterium]